jgi:16S rRNA processing protein RimM
MASYAEDDRLVVVGTVAGLYGVKGWVRIRSFTDPPGNIVDYQPWVFDDHGQRKHRRVEQARTHGSGLVARLEGISDREIARELIGADIRVSRDQFPEANRQEFYWSDLIGMQVRNAQGVMFGTVDHLLSTGANDVLVIVGERKRLVPFLMPGTVRSVDLASRVIEVDWDADF